MIASKTTYRRQKLAVGNAVGEVLHNGDAFSQQCAVIQQQSRNLSFRVDCQVIITVFQAFFCEIDAIKRKVFANFAQGNMGSKRAGTRFVEQFHR